MVMNAASGKILFLRHRSFSVFVFAFKQSFSFFLSSLQLAWGHRSASSGASINLIITAPMLSECFDSFRVCTQFSSMEGNPEAASLVFPSDRLSHSHDSRRGRDPREQSKPQRREVSEPRSHSKSAAHRGLKSRSLYTPRSCVTF